MIYRFYDTDATGTANYDLTGEEYRVLLDKCFEYSAFLSFFVRSPGVSLPPALESCRIPVTPAMAAHYERYAVAGQGHAYRLSPQSRSCILEITDSLFKWLDGWGQHHPEDPVFYRADGSVFFSSVIHDGFATLHPRENEDVSTVIQNPLWLKTNIP